MINPLFDIYRTIGKVERFGLTFTIKSDWMSVWGI